MELLKDKAIIVTGASSGLGRSTAIAISKEGGRLILIGRDETRLSETKNMLEYSDNHIAIPFDLLEFEKYDQLFQRIKEENIILNGMVHCAGFTRILPIRALTTQNMNELLAIHYISFVNLVKFYSKKGMNAGGSIVGISAINAHIPQKCMTAYASAKAAMETACRTMSIELIEKNIRINSVVVGSMSTEMSKDVASSIEGVSSSYVNPVSRQLIPTVTADVISGSIMFLLSDLSSYMTGRELYADGGLL
ncbi:MAG: SDR family oxidoreductase [Lachnospiraceae bacterium]|nr:SDR family oxidoreductase [Lachnospiraceae bacterium]